LLFFYWEEVMADTDKAQTTNERRKLPGDTEERKVRALEQIASTLTQIHHELIQVRVQAANVNVTLARKR
jgi:hypothetical protein